MNFLCLLLSYLLVTSFILTSNEVKIKEVTIFEVLFMQQNNKTVLTSDELSDFLLSKGIELNDLRGSIGKAIAAYNDTTGNYPASFRGYTISAITTVSLRDILSNKGYEKHSPHNIELTLNKDNGFAIHVVRGDQQTGLPSGYPSTERAKGERSLDFFGLKTSATNQPDLFQDELTLRKLPNCPYDIWFLMIYISKNIDGEVIIRAEFSKPESCSQKGMINGFSQRYIIDMNDFSNNMIIGLTDDPSDSFSDDIDLDISINE